MKIAPLLGMWETGKGSGCVRLCWGWWGEVAEGFGGGGGGGGGGELASMNS